MKNIFGLIVCSVILFVCHGDVSSNDTKMDDIYNLELVKDSPQEEIEMILFHVGTREIVPMQQNIINKLSGNKVKFVVILSPAISKAEYLSGINDEAIEKILLVDYPKNITDWSQDRYMRFLNRQGEPVLLPVLSNILLMDNNRGPFELGIPRILRDRKIVANADVPLTDVAIDNNSGEIFYNVDYYKNFFRGEVCSLFYGEHGDRLVTEKYMFVGSSTLRQMLNKLETTNDPVALMRKMTKKEIVAIDAEKEYERYFYHIDMYMTPVEGMEGDSQKDTIFFGSLEYTLKYMFHGVIPDYIDKYMFEKKLQREIIIKRSLADKFKIVEIPLLYLSIVKNGIRQNIVCTFNNGIFNGYDFLAPDYEFSIPEIDSLIMQSKKIVSKTFAEYGIRVVFIKNGEGSVYNGGEIRCTSAILKTRTKFSFALK